MLEENRQHDIIDSTGEDRVSRTLKSSVVSKTTRFNIISIIVVEGTGSSENNTDMRSGPHPQPI